MKIRPRDERLLVRPEKPPDKIGNILLPDSAKHKPVRGTVIAVGPGKLLEDGTRVAMDLKPGDEVIYGQYAGQEFEPEPGGEKLLFLGSLDVLAKVER